MAGLPIVITAPDHPHKGERAVIASSAMCSKLSRPRTADGEGRLAVLDNCPHGVDYCYIFPGQFRTICERRASR